MAAKVLWVIKGLGPGGAERLLAASAQAHDPASVSIECVFVLPHKDHLAEQLEAAGVVTRCIGRRRFDLGWPVRLWREVRGGRWDVVHVHSPLPGSVARLAGRSMRRSDRPALVTTEHNAWGTFATPTRWVNRWTIGGDAAILAVSDEVAESLEGPARRRVEVLEHGIDLAGVRTQLTERGAVRHELGLADADPVIVTVANFREQKDHPNLVAAMARLVEEGFTTRLVIVGQGPLEAEVRALVTRRGLDDVITLTGYRADATRVMAAADVFVLASRWEGLPVALMEATALGLPIVATRVGGVAEAMTDGVDARLVPPSDPAALAAALGEVMASPSLRAELGAGALRRSEGFSADRAQRAIEQVYRRVAPHPDVAEHTVDGQRRARASSTHEGIEIRRAVAADRDGILALMAGSLGWDGDPRFADLYAWKHDDNVFGPSPTWVAVVDDRVVALRAFMRWEFVRGGQVVRAVRAVDTATDPEYRGRGLFTALTLGALDAARDEGVAFVFNTPNDQSRPGYLAMGWREVGTVAAAVRVRDASSAARVVRARVPAELWSEPLDVGEPVTSWLDNRNGRVDTGSPVDVRSLRTDPTAAFLRWRFGLPSLGYRAIACGDATVIVRARRRGPVRELAHVLTVEGDDRSVGAHLGRLLDDTGADHVIRLGPPDLRHGVVPLPGGGPVLTWRSVTEKAMPPRDNWALTLGDIELF